MADTASINAEGAPAPASESRNGKVVQLRRAVQDRAGQINGWAQDQAKAIAATAKERPLATAGISAGAAFGFGIVIGLLLARAAAPPEPDWKERLMQLRPHW